MKLCDNCLGEGGVRPLPVGHDRGTQRDPYRVTLDLCESCTETLGGPPGCEHPASLEAFHARWVAAREVTR